MDRNTFTKIFSAISDLHFLSSIFKSLFSGHDAPDDAHDAVKGMSGIFGFADERKMLILLEALDNKTPGAADTVLNYLTREFSREGVSLEAAVYIIRQKARFRDMLVDMGTSEGTKIGETTTVLKGNVSGQTATTTRKEEIRGPGRNNALNLLVRMHAILTSHATEVEGDAACTKFLLSAGAPMVNRKLVANLDGGATKAYAAIMAQYDKLSKKTAVQKQHATEYVGQQANALKKLNQRNRREVSVASRLIRVIFRI